MIEHVHTEYDYPPADLCLSFHETCVTDIWDKVKGDYWTYTHHTSCSAALCRNGSAGKGRAMMGEMARAKMNMIVLN